MPLSERIDEMNISGDKFNQYIKSKVPLSSILLRSKNINYAFDIKGLKLKEKKENMLLTNAKMDIVLNEDTLKKNHINS